MRQGFGSCRITRHGKRKRGFDLDALTRRKQASKPLPLLPSFRSIAVSGFSQGRIRLRDCPTFLAVRPDGRVHSPLGQFPRFGKMPAVRLGIGCEPQSKVLVFGLARKPLLLFRHRRRVRPEKGKPIESGVELVIIQFSRLRLVNDLPRLVKTLLCKS